MTKYSDIPVIPGYELYRGTFIPEGDEKARAAVDRDWADPRMAQIMAAFDATNDAHAEVMLLDEMNKRARELSEPEATPWRIK